MTKKSKKNEQEVKESEKVECDCENCENENCECEGCQEEVSEEEQVMIQLYTLISEQHMLHSKIVGEDKHYMIDIFTYDLMSFDLKSVNLTVEEAKEKLEQCNAAILQVIEHMKKIQKTLDNSEE